MKLTYCVSDLAYSAKQISEFLNLKNTLPGDTFSSMGNAIFSLYPTIREDEIRLLTQTELEEYCMDRLRYSYCVNRPKFAEKATTYQCMWDKYSDIVELSLGEIFQTDTTKSFSDMQARVTLCPICPRFLEDHAFDIFHQYSAEGALYLAMHEITHFLWFDTWSKLFNDSPDLYEQPHLPWIFSELAIDAILSDPRLNHLIFNEEQAKFPAYAEFYEIYSDEGSLIKLFRNMFNQLSINDFMREGYRFLNQNKSLFSPYFG